MLTIKPPSAGAAVAIKPLPISCCLLLLFAVSARAAEPAPVAYADPKPQPYHLTARASEIDPRASPHPDIDFVFTDKAGKPQDLENAVVDTRVAPRGIRVNLSCESPLFIEIWSLARVVATAFH